MTLPDQHRGVATLGSWQACRHEDAVMFAHCSSCSWERPWIRKGWHYLYNMALSMNGVPHVTPYDWWFPDCKWPMLGVPPFMDNTITVYTTFPCLLTDPHPFWGQFNPIQSVSFALYLPGLSFTRNQWSAVTQRNLTNLACKHWHSTIWCWAQHRLELTTYTCIVV